MKEMLQVTLPLVGVAAIFCVVMWLVPQTCGPKDNESAVTLVADTSIDDTIETLHDYGKAVDEHVQVCDELLATAKAADQVANACMDQLRQCMGMLESNYLIPKEEKAP